MTFHPVYAGIDHCLKTIHLSVMDAENSLDSLYADEISPEHKKFVAHISKNLRPFFENGHQAPLDFFKGILSNKKYSPACQLLDKVIKSFEADMIHSVALIHSGDYKRTNKDDYYALRGHQKEHQKMMRGFRPLDSKTANELLISSRHATRYLEKDFSPMKENVIVSGIVIGLKTLAKPDGREFTDGVKSLVRESGIDPVYRRVIEEIATHVHHAVEEEVCSPLEIYLSTLKQEKGSAGYSVVTAALYCHNKDLTKMEKKAVKKNKSPERIEELRHEQYMCRSLTNKLPHLSVDEEFYKNVDYIRGVENNLFLEKTLKLITYDQ